MEEREPVELGDHLAEIKEGLARAQRILVGEEEGEVDWSRVLPLAFIRHTPKSFHYEVLQCLLTTVEEARVPIHHGILHSLLQWLQQWIGECPGVVEDIGYSTALAKIHCLLGQWGRGIKRYRSTLNMALARRAQGPILEMVHVLFFLYGQFGDHVSIKTMLDALDKQDELKSFLVCWRYIVATKERDVVTEQRLQDDVVLIFLEETGADLQFYAMYCVGHVVLRWMAQGRMDLHRYALSNQVCLALGQYINAGHDNERVSISRDTDIKPLYLRILLSMGHLSSSRALQEHEGRTYESSDGYVELLLHKLHPLATSVCVSPSHLMQICRSRVASVKSGSWAATTLRLLKTASHIAHRFHRDDMIPEIEGMIRSVCARTRGLEEMVTAEYYWSDEERIVQEFLLGVNEDQTIRLVKRYAIDVGIVNYYKNCPGAPIIEVMASDKPYPDLVRNAFRILVVRVLTEPERASQAWEDLQDLYRDDAVSTDMAELHHDVAYRYLQARMGANSALLNQCKEDIEKRLEEIAEEYTVAAKQWTELSFLLLWVVLTRDRLVISGTILRLLCKILTNHLTDFSCIISPLSPPKYNLQTIACHLVTFLHVSKRRVEAEALGQAYLVYLSLLTTYTGRTYDVPRCIKTLLKGASASVKPSEFLLAADAGGLTSDASWKEPLVKTTTKRNQKRREKKQQKQHLPPAPPLSPEADTPELQMEPATVPDPETECTDMAEDAPVHLVCPITFELMTEAVVASDGHTYQHQSLLLHMEYARSRNRLLLSPMTNLPIDPGVCIPNYTVRSLVKEYIEQKQL